jgi:hypothetical protein
MQRRTGREQPWHQCPLGRQSPEVQGDRHIVFRPVHDVDRVARPYLTRLDHPQTGARRTSLREPPHPPFLTQMALERHTGDTPAGDLQDHLGPDPPALADQRAGHVQPTRGHVLAEHPVAQWAVQLAFPFVEILARDRVHRLFVAAVVLLRAHRVPGHDPRSRTTPSSRHSPPYSSLRHGTFDHDHTPSHSCPKARRVIRHRIQGSLMIEK